MLSPAAGPHFIFTSPTFVANPVSDKLGKEKREFYIPKLQRESCLYGTEFEIRLKNELTQKAIAKECADWIRRKVQFRSNRMETPMQQFARVENGNKEHSTYLPLNGFTAVDLGYQKGNAVSNFINKMEHTETAGVYLKLFNEIWQDSHNLHFALSCG